MLLDNKQSSKTIGLWDLGMLVWGVDVLWGSVFKAAFAFILRKIQSKRWQQEWRFDVAILIFMFVAFCRGGKSSGQHKQRCLQGTGASNK